EEYLTMGFKTIELVYEHSRAKGVPRSILAAIAYHTNDKRPELGCWPSLETLAKETGFEKRTICRAADHLEKIGDLRRQRSTGGFNKQTCYFITVEQKQCQRVTVFQEKQCQRVTQTVSESPRNSVRESHAINKNRTGRNRKGNQRTHTGQTT